MTVENSSLAFELLVDRTGNLWIGEFVTVSKLDFRSKQQVRFFGIECFGLALHPVDKQSIYATSSSDGRVFRIDTVTEERQEVLSGCLGVSSLSFTSTGDMFVSHQSIATIQLSLYTAAQLPNSQSTAEPTTTINVPNQEGPWSVRVNPKNDREVFVSFHYTHSVVKLVDNKVATIWQEAASTSSGRSTKNSCIAMAFYNDYLLVVVRKENNSRIRVVDLKSGTMSTLDIELAEGMIGLAVDSVQHLIYVSANHGKSIYKLHFVDTTDNQTLFNQVPLSCPTDIAIQ